MCSVRRRMGRPILGAVLGCALVFAGCATTGEVESPKADARETEAAAAAAETADAVKVRSVSVVGDGDRVLISTDGTVRYTVFKLSDPPRLIVDMPGVDLAGVKSPLKVENDFITDITSRSYGDDSIGRVTIGLSEGVDHDVKSGDGTILVSLEPSSNPATAGARTTAPEVVKASAEVAPESAGDLETAAIETAPGVSETVKEAADAGVSPEKISAEAASSLPSVEDVEREVARSMAPASKLVSLDAASVGPATTVSISADGTVGDYTVFKLSDPSRVVVDVWGVTNTIVEDKVSVGSDSVSRVRIGNHPDKARIVFDSDLPEPPAHNITRSGDTLVVTLGEGAAVAAAASAEAPAAEDRVMTASIDRAAASTGPSGEEEVAQVETPLWEWTGTESVAAEEDAAEADLTEDAAQSDDSMNDDSATASEEAAGGDASGMNPDETARPATAAAPPTREDMVRDMMAGEAEEAGATMKPDAPAPVEVSEVSFRKLPDKATLTVTVSGKAAFEVKESDDGRTVAVDVRDAVIPEKLQRTLDATRLKTPVQTVSSYQESLLPEKVVRVLVKLSEDTEFEVNELDGVIKVDFPAADAAARKAAAKEGMTVEEAIEAKEKEYTGRRIDLDMTDANIRDVIRLMAEVSDLNIIATDAVTGTVTLRLKGVPWDQAFDIILKSKGLDKIREGNVVRVAPEAQIRREREEALAAVKAEEKLEDLQLEFIPINYANAGELAGHVENVLTERGTVTSETRTNTLIVKDIKKGIKSAKHLITKLDTAIPQVLIEARIVEATSSFARDLGIQWGADFQTGGNVSTDTFGATTTSGQTPPSSTDQPAFATRHGADSFAVNLPASGSAGTLGALGFVFGKVGANPLVLDLRLTAGEQEGRLKTISRPRVTTLDNKEAKIEQGESIPFETTSASGTSTTFIDANLSLTVTPHITPDGSVLMQIKASRNSIGTFRTASGEPSINKKEASTEVLVRDGETTVIGGIVVSDTSETDRGIPFLKDIPLLGWMFKNKSVSDTQTELLIFLTPTIMKEKEQERG